MLIAGKILSADSYKDYFKVSKIKGTEQITVPEPSSMVLAAMTLFGIGGIVRARAKA